MTEPKLPGFTGYLSLEAVSSMYQSSGGDTLGYNSRNGTVEMALTVAQCQKLCRCCGNTGHDACCEGCAQCQEGPPWL
jgi:hypothetical protein